MVEIYGSILYPTVLNDSGLMMNNCTIEIPSMVKDNCIVPAPKCGVTAANLIDINATTEVIDIRHLPQDNNSLIKYVS